MDYNALRVEMAKNQLSYADIIRVLGISEGAWYSKINGKTQFKLDEVRKLAKLLNLTHEQIDEIFFKM